MNRRAVAVFSLMIGNLLFSALIYLVFASLDTAQAQLATASPILAGVASVAVLGPILGAIGILLWVLLFVRAFR